MDYIIIGLCTIIIILMIAILFKLLTTKNIDSYLSSIESLNKDHINNQFQNFTDRFDLRIKDLFSRNADFERALNQTFNQFQTNLNQHNATQFAAVQEVIEKRLNLVDQKVNESLNDGFKKTNETFTNIVERLSKIDEAQKKIDALSTDIISLQDVLTDKKTRGAFGEVQLSHILSSIFGENNSRIYKLQHNLTPTSRADAVLFAPEPLGVVAIDSKFPLENYRKMVEASNDSEKILATKLFVSDCKKHIDAIASKYIIDGVTSDQAILFLPAEAIFATINAYHPEILDYSQRRRVWLTSPTTLMSTLTTIQTILINMEREKYAAVIHEQLKILGTEFGRYKVRWQALSKRMQGMNEDFKDINITTEKITKRFEEISNVEIALETATEEENPS